MLINIENKPNTLIQGMAFETYVINVLKDYLSVQKNLFVLRLTMNYLMHIYQMV